MNRDTARAIIAAAALMTVQALLLAVLASNTAQASPVYRCATADAGAAITYQMQPCANSPGVRVRTADARTRDQQQQASANHSRHMDWLDHQDMRASSSKARAPSKKRRAAARKTSSAPNRALATAAVPLTSHRIGQRPFERLGQQVTPPDNSLKKPKKPRRASHEVTARTPAPSKAGSVRLSP